MGLFDRGAVLDVILERIDRNDGLVVLLEWIVVRGDSVANSLNAIAIKSGEGYREPGPELLLELGQRRIVGDDQDSAGATAKDEFRCDEAGFERLAETHIVTDQEPDSPLLQGAFDRHVLEGQVIDSRLASHKRNRSRWCGSAKRCFEVEPRILET